MKKLIIASFVSLAFTGNAFACGEIPEVKASVKPEVLASVKQDNAVSNKSEIKELVENVVKVSTETTVEASDTPEAKAD